VIRIGPAGSSYKDWEGIVYPQKPFSKAIEFREEQAPLRNDGRRNSRSDRNFPKHVLVGAKLERRLPSLIPEEFGPRNCGQKSWPASSATPAKTGSVTSARARIANTPSAVKGGSLRRSRK